MAISHASMNLFAVCVCWPQVVEVDGRDSRGHAGRLVLESSRPSVTVSPLFLGHFCLSWIVKLSGIEEQRPRSASLLEKRAKVLF